MAQVRITDHNNIGWFTTIITPQITKKVSGHIEYQYRRENWVTNWQQSLLRAGINYKFNPQVTGHIGYGWILTYPYGEFNISGIAKTFPEHRVYEQLVLSTTIGKVSLSQRFRLEQRWVGKYKSISSDGVDNWTYLDRVRYMLRADIPVYKKSYFGMYDEIFIGFGKNVGENIFDQNRICLLAGYKFNDAIKLEAGYINQRVMLGREIGGQNVVQNNNGFVISSYFQIK